MNRAWNLLQPDDKTVAHLAGALSLAPEIATVLVNRGLDDPAAGRHLSAPVAGPVASA